MFNTQVTNLIGRWKRRRGHVNVRISSRDNDITNISDMPNDGRAEAMLAAMDLDNYKPSYNGYALFQPAKTVGKECIDMACNHKTNLEVYKGSHLSPTHADRRSSE